MKLMSVFALLIFSTLAFASGSNTVFIERYDVEKIFRIPDSGVIEDKKLERVIVTVSQEDYENVFDQAETTGEPVEVKLGPYLPLDFEIVYDSGTGEPFLLAYSLNGTPVFLIAGNANGSCRETNT